VSKTKRVTLSVQATGYITAEMDTEQWREIDAKLADGDTIDLDEVHGVDWDSIVNELRFEVDDAEVVTAKRRRK